MKNLTIFCWSIILTLTVLKAVELGVTWRIGQENRAMMQQTNRNLGKAIARMRDEIKAKKPKPSDAPCDLGEDFVILEDK